MTLSSFFVSLFLLLSSGAFAGDPIHPTEELGESSGTLAQENRQLQIQDFFSNFLTAGSADKSATAVGIISEWSKQDVVVRDAFIKLFSDSISKILETRRVEEINWVLLERLLGGLVRVYNKVSEKQQIPSLTHKVYEVVSRVAKEVQDIDGKKVSVGNLDFDRSRIAIVVRCIELLAYMVAGDPWSMNKILPKELDYSASKFVEGAQLNEEHIRGMYQVVLFMARPVSELRIARDFLHAERYEVVRGEEIFWKLHAAIGVFAELETWAGLDFPAHPYRVLLEDKESLPLKIDYTEYKAKIKDKRVKDTDLWDAFTHERQITRFERQQLPSTIVLLRHNNSDADAIMKYRAYLSR